MDHIEESFAVAVQWIYGCRGRVIVTGIGKSGIVGRKIVATLSSTGTPALFLHPVEAMHGDLGMIRGEDIVLALSNSGETTELNVILPSLRNIGTRIISFTGKTDSTLARHSDLAIYAGVPREACPMGLAPTASTTAMLALGDALAVALIKLRNFQERDFHRYHPAGYLGERLDVPICEVMRRGDAIPSVHEDTPVLEALNEMSRKGMGATLVLGKKEELLGIYTDGDVRRTLNRHSDVREIRMREVMSPRPPDSFDEMLGGRGPGNDGTTPHHRSSRGRRGRTAAGNPSSSRSAGKRPNPVYPLTIHGAEVHPRALSAGGAAGNRSLPAEVHPFASWPPCPSRGIFFPVNFPLQLPLRNNSR